MNTVNYAIIGCGTISHFHASAISAVEGATLVGAFDINENTAQAFGQEYGIPSFDDLQQLFDSVALDVAIVCTPTGSRLPIVTQAAARGIHVLVEKPLETTLDRGRKLVDICRSQNVLLGCVLQYRFYKDVKQVRELIHNGDLGQVVLIETQIKWHRPTEYYAQSSWRGTWQHDGGGVLMNQGIHSIDLMQWFMGPVAHVSGFGKTLHHPIEVEDTAVVCLEYASGALGVICASTAISPGTPAMLTVSGTNGTAILRGEELAYLCCLNPDIPSIDKLGSLRANGSGGDTPTSISNLGHVHVINDMTQAVIEHRRPGVPGEEALKPIDLIDRIYKGFEKRER